MSSFSAGPVYLIAGLLSEKGNFSATVNIPEFLPLAHRKSC
jgi:hypothetical protein